MKLFTHAMVLSLSLLATSAAFAEARIAGRPVASCEIEIPFKLHPSETAQLESKGYTLNVKRSHFRYGRFNQLYRFYEVKSGAPTGTLQMKTVLVPKKSPAIYSRREFVLNAALPYGTNTIGMTSATPPFFATHGENVLAADFSGFPTCSAQ